MNGFTVEMGGQWVGRTQTAVLALIDELGLQTYPTYDTGAGITARDGTVIRYEDETLGLPEEGLTEIARLQSELERLAATVPLASPWATPEAGELDRHTFDSWLTMHTDERIALAFYRLLSRGIFSAEASEMAVLHFLFYIASGGMIDVLIGTTGGAQELRIEGGSPSDQRADGGGTGRGCHRARQPCARDHAGRGCCHGGPRRRPPPEDTDSR